MIGLIKDNDDTIYQQQLAMFVNHCDANFLELNVSKTKENDYWLQNFLFTP